MRGAWRMVVVGTGTGIGKTHVTEALALALGAAGRRVAAWKGVESGTTDTAPSDAARLAAVSSFHVKHRLEAAYAFGPPVSPHIAARQDGVRIEASVLAERAEALAAEVDDLLVELPGGLWSPLATEPLVTNGDLLGALHPDVVLLVAPDRLGVLHDIGAVARSAALATASLTGVLLVAPVTADASSGTNGDEVPRLAPQTLPYLGTWPRAPTSALLPFAAALLERLRPEGPAPRTVASAP